MAVAFRSVPATTRDWPAAAAMAEPLGEGGGSALLVVACGGVAVMALLLSGWGGPLKWLAGSLATRGRMAFGCCFPVSAFRLQLKAKTSNLFPECSIHFSAPES